MVQKLLVFLIAHLILHLQVIKYVRALARLNFHSIARANHAVHGGSTKSLERNNGFLCFVLWYRTYVHNVTRTNNNDDKTDSSRKDDNT